MLDWETGDRVTCLVGKWSFALMSDLKGMGYRVYCTERDESELSPLDSLLTAQSMFGHVAVSCLTKAATGKGFLSQTSVTPAYCHLYLVGLLILLSHKRLSEPIAQVGSVSDLPAMHAQICKVAPVTIITGTSVLPQVGLSLRWEWLARNGSDPLRTSCEWACSRCGLEHAQHVHFWLCGIGTNARLIPKKKKKKHLANP
jgi:hypothetical protein